MQYVTGVSDQDNQFSSWGKLGGWWVKYDDPEKFLKYLIDHDAYVFTHPSQFGDVDECSIKIDGMKPKWKYKGLKYRHVGYIHVVDKGWAVTKGLEVQKYLNKLFFGR